MTGAVTGTVLVRLVNAGQRMHVPSILNSLTSGFSGAGVPATTVSGFALIAEDGNPMPGVPRVQSEVFMAAGKTYDLMINVPASGSSALAIYDRELSLSGGATQRDAGMLAYIGVNGASLPTTGAFSASGAAALAVADTYNSIVAGQTLTVSDPGKGVVANDTNVYGVTLMTTPAATGGTVVLNRNGNLNVPAGKTLISAHAEYKDKRTELVVRASRLLTFAGETPAPQQFCPELLNGIGPHAPRFLMICSVIVAVVPSPPRSRVRPTPA